MIVWVKNNQQFKDSEIVRNTEDGTTVYVGQAIRAADAAFASPVEF